MYSNTVKLYHQNGKYCKLTLSKLRAAAVISIKHKHVNTSHIQCTVTFIFIIMFNKRMRITAYIKKLSATHLYEVKKHTTPKLQELN